MNRVAFCIFFLLVCRCAHARDVPTVDVSKVTGANVDESGLTTIEVSAESGSDDNSGAEGSPVKTLGKAFEIASTALRDEIPTRIAINPGVYRESGIEIDAKKIGGKAAQTTFVIEGKTGVIWNGADIADNWKVEDAKAGIISLAWKNVGDPEIGPVSADGRKSLPGLMPEVSHRDGADYVELHWERVGANSEISMEKATGTRGGQMANYAAMTMDAESGFISDSLPSVDQVNLYRLCAKDMNGTLRTSPEIQATGFLRYVPNALGRRCELVFVDGMRYRQVSDPTRLSAGTYAIGSEGSDSRLWIQLKSPPSSAKPLLETAGNGASRSLLTIRNKDNMVVRGITFKHAACPAINYGALRIGDCSNVMVQNCMFRNNNGSGLGIGAINSFSLLNCTFVDNGAGGVLGSGGRNQRWENNYIARNGWRTFGLGGERHWFHAGIKTGFGLTDAIFHRNTIVANESSGLWLDTCAANISVTELISEYNTDIGFYWEANSGPGTLAKTRLFRNGRAGLMIGDAGGLLVEDCEIIDNNCTQILIAVSGNALNPGRTFSHPRNGNDTVHTEPLNIEWRDNVIAAREPGQLILRFQWGCEVGYLQFWNSLKTSGNLFWHPATTVCFANPLGERFPDLGFEAWLKSHGPKRTRKTMKIDSWHDPGVVDSAR